MISWGMPTIPINGAAGRLLSSKNGAYQSKFHSFDPIFRRLSGPRIISGPFIPRIEKKPSHPSEPTAIPFPFLRTTIVSFPCSPSDFPPVTFFVPDHLSDSISISIRHASLSFLTASSHSTRGDPLSLFS
jgi:hypothetical protein